MRRKLPSRTVLFSVTSLMLYVFVVRNRFGEFIILLRQICNLALVDL